MGLFRMLLAVCVLFTHTAPPGGLSWLPGAAAVEAFFVISGFYMQMILDEKYTQARLGDHWMRRFYLARYFRLLPAYLACLLLTLIATWVGVRLTHRPLEPFAVWSALANLTPSSRNVALWVWTVLSNLTIFLQDLGEVLGVRGGDATFTWINAQSEVYIRDACVMGHAWSLGVEISFYLLAPYLLKLRRLLLPFAGMLALKLAAIQFLDNALPYQMLPFVLVNFLGGALMYRYRHFVSRGGYPGIAAAYFLVLVIVLGLPVSLTSSQISLLAIGLTMIAVPILFEWTRNNRLDAFLANLSYPFYIFHMLCANVAGFVFLKLGSHAQGTSWAIATLCVNTFVAYLVLRTETRFIEPLRSRLGTPRRAIEEEGHPA